MQAFRSWLWSILVVAFAFTAPTARAGMITPDSIPNPPSTVASANGTPVYASNFVSTQYAGLGLNFSGEAITRLNGISVWAPVSLVSGNSSVNSSSGIISYFGPWAGGSFVLPSSSKLTTVSSLSMEIVGNWKPGSIGVNGLNGQQLNLLPVVQSSPGPHGGQVWTFTGSGIASFSGFTPVADGLPNFNPAWGVAEISFTSASTPEPSSLALAGLGALGLVARLGWRRIRRGSSTR